MATQSKTAKKAPATTTPEANGQPPASQLTGADVQAKFASARKALASALIERDDETDVVLSALIAGEHPLLVGPPGTAKSLLLDSLTRWTAGRGFSILLTKFSTPEELFGPVSVQGLKADQYRRITTGKLPEADVAFIDEVFKGSSAILNTLLRILNERVYDNGDGTFRPVPLQICVAASNEWPGSESGGRELGALFDRFLFRKKVRPVVGQDARERLLAVPVAGAPPVSRDHSPAFADTVTPAEIEQARREAHALAYTPDAKDALLTILRDLAKEGVLPGDRRQYKSVAAAQAFAYLAGATEVRPEHLEILQHTLWDDPAEQPEKVAQVVSRVANPLGMQVNSLLLEVEGILAATDARNLAQAAAATNKLKEVHKKLSGLAAVGNGRVARALEYVEQQSRRIKTASMESL